MATSGCWIHYLLIRFQHLFFLLVCQVRLCGIHFVYYGNHGNVTKDMIVEVFKQKAALHENIRVISNDMIFKDVSFVIMCERVLN